MVHDHSYGIIPLRKQGDSWEVFLIKHSSAGYWGFPKGHPDEGELPKQAAIRELKEETHLDVVEFFSETMIEEHYHFIFHGKHINKTVGYLVAMVSGEPILQQKEVSGGRWVALVEAFDVLTYATDKEVLISAQRILQ